MLLKQLMAKENKFRSPFLFITLETIPPPRVPPSSGPFLGHRDLNSTATPCLSEQLDHQFGGTNVERIKMMTEVQKKAVQLRILQPKQYFWRLKTLRIKRSTTESSYRPGLLPRATYRASGPLCLLFEQDCHFSFNFLTHLICCNKLKLISKSTDG